MKTLIIYDNKAAVVAAIHGAEAVPEGVQGFLMDLREGETVTGSTVDLSDPANPRVETSGGIDAQKIEAALAKVQNEVADINMVLADLIGGVLNA